MYLSRRIILLFIAFGVFVCAKAQNDKQTETKEIYFRVRQAFKFRDTMIVYLDVKNPKEIGIKRGLLAKAYQAYLPAVEDVSPERLFHEVGAGKMVVVDSLMGGDTITACFVKLYHPSDSLAEGDFVSLNLNVPTLPYRSIFSELAFRNIEFNNYERKPLYNLNNIIFHDSRQAEDSIFSVIVNDLHNTYELIKDRTNLPDKIKTKATKGRYAGKNVLDVLKNATKKDVQDFFLYVKAYPSGYMGLAFRGSESMAGWLSSNSPYSYTEVKEILFPIYKNKTEFTKLLPLYKSDILAEADCESFGADAVNLSVQLKFSEAHQLIDFAEALAIGVNDTAGKSIVYLSKAAIYQNEDKYAEAITEADKAIRYALVSSKKDNEMEALLIKIYGLYKLSRRSEAVTNLDYLKNKLGEYRSALGESEYKKNLEKYFEYNGAIKYASGDYTLALKDFDEATQLNTEIGSYNALVNNASLYKFLGQVNNDQGKPGEAFKTFTKARDIYRSVNDNYKQALIENEMAYSEYNSGNYQSAVGICKSVFQKLSEHGDYNNAGYSKSLMGSCYWELGFYDSAVLAHKESITLRKQANNLAGQAYSWKSLGQLYQLSGVKPEALAAFDSAAFLYTRLNDSSGLAGTYIEKGTVFYNDENYKKAVNLFEKAKALPGKTTVESFYNLGNAWLEIDTAKANSYFKACKEKSEIAGSTGYIFYSTLALASIAYNNRDNKLGNKFYEQCLQQRKELNTDESYAYCHVLKAQHFYIDMELDSALHYYYEAKDIFDTLSKAGVVRQLNNVSNVYISKGEFAKAEEALTKAIEISKLSHNYLGLGNSLQSSSFLYGLTGEFDKGIKNNDSAMVIFRSSGNMLRLANTYVSRGTLLKSMGDYKRSIQSFLFADSLFKDEQTNEYRQTVSIDIGVTYYTQGNYQTAIKYFEQALTQMKQNIIDENYLTAKANIAECLLYLNKYKEAETIYLQVFPQAKGKLNRIASGMALGLGKLYYNKGQFAKAKEYFKYAIDYAYASGEKEKIVEGETYTGRINMQEEKVDTAENNFRRASLVVTQYKMGAGWEPFYELGLLYYGQKKFDSSVVYLKQAVDLLEKDAENLYGGEEARKIFNNDPRKSDLYDKITFAYFNLGNDKEAWAYANRSNSAGIKEKSGGLSSATNNKERLDALKQLATLKQTKKALEAAAEKQKGEEREQTLKRIEILEEDYTNFLQDLIAKDSTLSDYFAKSDADEFYNYKEKLPRDVAVALYLLNDKTLMVITLTNEKLAIDTMTADIGKTVAAFIAAAKQPQRPTGTGALKLRSEPTDEDGKVVNIPFKDLSDTLYNTLITPIYDDIKNKQKLCIIPTGIFSNMPFQCLGKKLADGSFHFLLEDHGIFYTNKMKIFENSRDTIHNITNLYSFAAFGVPDKTLKYNTEEVKEIGKILGVDSTIYADGRATESMAKTSLVQKKYIHFATHGVLNYSNEFSQSYLKFLPDKDSSNGNNGQLTIREIQRLGIRDCNLVILSACETAINKELVKGWNISPANAFLERRVKSVIASLWKVDDEATNILMNEFYRNLKTMATVDALRLAQETLSNNPKYSHPFYWGAFVLYGDWR